MRDFDTQFNEERNNVKFVKEYVVLEINCINDTLRYMLLILEK